MSDISARKSIRVTNSREAKSKKLDETIDKLKETGATQDNDQAPKAISVESGSRLTTLRIHDASESAIDDDLEIRASRGGDKASGEHEAALDNLVAQKYSDVQPLYERKRYNVTMLIGFVVTGLWLGAGVFYVNNNMGWGGLLELEPHVLGGFLSGILAPLALLWMTLAYIQRGADVHMYSQSLRHELQSMIFPSEERSKIIHKDIEALCKQATELSSSSKDILTSIHKARIGLRLSLIHI